MRYIFHLLKEKKCQLVFIISFFIAYTIIPIDYLSGPMVVLAVFFMISFGLLITCIIREVKNNLSSIQSILGIFGVLVGGIALNTCTVICGAGLIGLISFILPATLFEFFQEHAPILLIFSIGIQLYSMKSLGCFSETC